MNGFYDLRNKSQNEADIIPEILKGIIEKVKEYKSQNQSFCSGSDKRYRIGDPSGLPDPLEEDPHEAERLSYVLERETAKLPYTVLYKIEACMMCGMDICDMYRKEQDRYEDFDDYIRTDKRNPVSLRDYKALAYYYDIPTKEKTTNRKHDLVDYISSKQDLDIYLTAYLKAYETD